MNNPYLEIEMTATELKAYAEKEIARLSLGDSPTNCHGVVAYGTGTGEDAVRLSDGVGLDEVCRTTDEIDAELAAMAEWYAETDSTNEKTAYEYAKRSQGFEGTYEQWLALPADEREEYEQGAAGIPTS